jgi:hypothetical protein
VLLTSDANAELMAAQLGEHDGEQTAAGRWQLVAKHPVKIGFKMPTHIYLLYRLVRSVLAHSRPHRRRRLARLSTSCTRAPASPYW